MFENIEVHIENMRKACKQGFLNATDLADYLVNRGMPFRQAHAVAGKAVAFAISQDKELEELSLEQMKSFSDLLEKDIYDFISLDQMIARRISYGGTGYDNVAKALESAKKELNIQ
jgi:argininosuccinate lyase